MTPVVLLHGNPETAVIWSKLIPLLRRDDVRAFSPPGFGSPVPDGFSATADGYVSWLISELEQVGQPVDLVGHDWGGGHVAGAVAARPDLVRSWAVDIAGCFAPDYRWHDLAQAWRAEGLGEQTVAAALSAPVADRAAVYESLDIPAPVAVDLAEAFDAEMGRCVLTLYRSAPESYMHALGNGLEQAAPPGLCLIATEDHYVGGPERARQSAQRIGAETAELPGLGHWWMLQDPAAGAHAMHQFWDRLH